MPRWLRRGWRRGSLERVPRGTEYRLVHLERLALGSSYVDQAARIVWLMGQPDLQAARLAIDATGVGRAVCDLFSDAAGWSSRRS
jgi:hypothetical protein